MVTAEIVTKADTSTSTHAVQAGWHTADSTQALQQLNVAPHIGLSDAEVINRQQQYGPNELVERVGKSVLAILWEQVTNPLVLLLIGAAVISAFLGKTDSVIAISAIVVLNAILGVVQEYRAEQAMAALKKMAAPLVRVRRNSRVSDVPSRDLVPGDVVLLEAGSIVPADARLIESANLSVQEAALTGESQPVEKAIATLVGDNIPLGDRLNMVYMGTAVTYGRGSAVVVETGMNTQLGRIAEMIQSVESEQTPLQRRMAEVGKVLLVVALVVMAIAFGIGLIVGERLQDVLLNAVAIAVAVVPEGLPAVVTIALALGAQRMLKRRALIRKLPAVETLGSVTTICSDKTGTLTENRMTVTIIDVADVTAPMNDVAAKGIHTVMTANGSAAPHDAAHALVLAGGVLCNDAILDKAQDGKPQIVGDPTEGALVIAASRFGLDKAQLEQAFARVGEAPFSSERKRMSTAHHIDPTRQLGSEERYLLTLLNSPYVLFTKGAVDSMLDVSDSVWLNGAVVPMSADLRQRIESANNKLAQDGLRVLGVGFRQMTALPDNWQPESVERNLTFVGMVGIIDPPREEVKQAVLTSRKAGIRPVMITGDHPLTAYTIARELNIATDGDRILTGQDLSQMTPAELEAQVEHVSVYARVSPEHKLDIVQALQKRGHIVAMTGDGVNDAPALKKADIGVAMGITGTAVSKEASDMVILDDNFATIVSAVEEGRTIYDNVRRFVKYLLASNTGELVVLLFTQLIQGMTLPLTTLQILWMNLITDGVPALALGVEKTEKNSMNRSPYAPNESIFGRGMARHIVLVGVLLGLTGLGLGYWAFSNNITAANGAPAWNTMVFIFLTLAQMGHALALRSHRESVFKIGILGNRLLLGAVCFTIVVQMLAIYTPFFNQLFNTNPLTLEQLVICLVLSTVVFWGVELEKAAIRKGWLQA
ncbi:MAG: cation-translocating P-type ATPase [Anaerolineae bacterium]|nr:cation-translocating P-type ATPase [Anaerolineae bacterium]